MQSLALVISEEDDEDDGLPRMTVSGREVTVGTVRLYCHGDDHQMRLVGESSDARLVETVILHMLKSVPLASSILACLAMR